MGLGLVEGGKIPKPLSKLFNMSRKYSLWMYQWGLACCAIEMAPHSGAPRDDIINLVASLGYVTEAPFLAAVGPVYSYTQAVDHEIERGRVGIWMQAWPFSSRSGEFVPFWTLRSRLDLWTTHTSRRWQPRLELTLGWERNIFQPNP